MKDDDEAEDSHGWALINISPANLAYLRRSARKHKRTPPKELEAILEEAGIIPKQTEEEEAFDKMKAAITAK